MAYATQRDLSAWLGADPLPADPDRLLTQASMAVDYALKASIYNVDSAGSPTDALVIGALRDATCAQVEWWMVTQDEVGEFDLYHNIASTDGGFTVQRLPGRKPRLAPRAREVLELAALLPAPIG